MNAVVLAAFTLVPAFALSLGPADAQGQGSSVGVPAVIFRFDPVYQGVVAPSTEGRSNPEDDVRWAERRTADLREFYSADGSRLLRLLSDYAGARWPYDEISVYVVRDFPTLSIQYPLTLAVGAIRQGEGRQEIPGGDFLALTLAHQISHYLMDPPPGELATSQPRGFDHPLMREGNYRREAMVNLVAYRALRDIWGAERLRGAVSEPLWTSYNPESAFLDSLQSRWTLSTSRPLASWLAQEPDEGRLVELAERLESSRVPEDGRATSSDSTRSPGMAGNDVGFDLGQTAEGRLFVAFMDPRSPADAAGLHANDIVATIEGRRFSSAIEAMRVVREAWDTNREVNLSVERQGKEVFFQVH